MYGREAEMIDHLQGLLSEFRAGEHHHDEMREVLFVQVIKCSGVDISSSYSAYITLVARNKKYFDNLCCYMNTMEAVVAGHPYGFLSELSTREHKERFEK